MSTFWSQVFARLVRARYHNATFQAAWPSVALVFEKRLGDVEKRMIGAVNSEASAFDFFESEFSHLNPAEQKALSGYTRNEWLDLEREG